MRGPRLGSAGVVLGLPVALATGYGLGTLGHVLGLVDIVSWVVLPLPVVAYGFLANRWWAVFPLPVIVGAIFLAVLRFVDARTGTCSVCDEDFDWSNYPYLFAASVVLPVTFVVLVGVGMRRARDGGRRARPARKVVGVDR